MQPILFKLKLSLILIVLLIPLKSWSQTDDQIAFLYNAGRETVDQSAALTELVTQAVYFASQERRALTLFGTIREVQPSRQFTYTPAPADLMKIEFLNGQMVQFTVTELNGQDFSGPTAFLRADHVLRFEIQWTGGDRPLSLSIYSTQTNGQRQGYAQGQMTILSQTAQVQLNLAGTSSFESDLSGVEYSTQYTWRGTVETPEITVNVDENRDFELVVARGLRNQRVSISRSRIELNSDAIMGNDILAFNNARIQTVFRDGAPSDPDYWEGNGGHLLFNQAVVGEIKALYEYPYAKIKLLRANGPDIELQKWLLAPQ